MKLIEYLQKERINKSQAATALGVGWLTVYRWCLGASVPMPASQERIEAWTAGAVTRADWPQRRGPKGGAA
jgi:hypothetical protein